MKNYSVKNWWLIAIVIMGISVTGCGKGQKEGKTVPVKIGAVLPLNGNDAVLGDFTLKGLQYAVDEQNAKGGLSGRKIELEILDSKGDPEEGVLSINKLMETEANPFLVYAIISDVAQAIKPVTEMRGTILMAAVGTDEFLHDSKFTVRNYITAETIGKEISQYLKDTLKAPDLTLLYSDNAYGRSVKDALAGNCISNGMKVSAVPYGENANDYAEVVASGVNKDAGFLFVTGIGDGLGRMLKQVIESGYTGKILCDQFITYPDVIRAAGEVLKGITYLDFAFDPESADPAIQAFVSGFEGKYNTKPQNFSVITYEGVRFLFSLAEKTGSTDAEDIIREVSNVQNYQGVFGTVTLSGRNLGFRVVFKTWF